jgi:hypothetical protein
MTGNMIRLGAPPQGKRTRVKALGFGLSIVGSTPTRPTWTCSQVEALSASATRAPGRSCPFFSVRRFRMGLTGLPWEVARGAQADCRSAAFGYWWFDSTTSHRRTAGAASRQRKHTNGTENPTGLWNLEAFGLPCFRDSCGAGSFERSLSNKVMTLRVPLSLYSGKGLGPFTPPPEPAAAPPRHAGAPAEPPPARDRARPGAPARCRSRSRSSSRRTRR